MRGPSPQQAPSFLLTLMRCASALSHVIQSDYRTCLIHGRMRQRLIARVAELTHPGRLQPDQPDHSQSPPVIRGDMLSWLGFSLGSAVKSVSDYFFDQAFTPGSQVS